MCKVMEDMRNETAWQTKIDSVRRWIKMGLSFEQIAQGEDLTVEQVKKIAGKQSA